MSFLIHSMTIYANFLLSVLISFVKENFSGVNLNQIAMIFFALIIFQVFIVVLIDKTKESFNELFNELELAIDTKDNEGIILWINKYKKMPFILKMALKQNKNNLFINVYHSMTLHNKLQDQLPEKNEKVKSIKRNKI